MLVIFFKEVFLMLKLRGNFIEELKEVDEL